MLIGLRFHLSWFLASSCVFSRSGGTETELADLGRAGRSFVLRPRSYTTFAQMRRIATEQARLDRLPTARDASHRYVLVFRALILITRPGLSSVLLRRPAVSSSR
jgi:hypothetical protein